ncbi:MAG: methyltransferase domain-containing protein [Rhodobacteraceae bacterium]|nr:methyltransferase domain-containing protein [Paracoccaceae bacterium]
MKCRVCDGTDLEPVLDLGDQPWCNNFLTEAQVGTEPLYPLNLMYCNSCRTSQLDYTVDKQIMFGDHTYLSGITKSLSDHFKGIAEDVDNRFGDGFTKKSILDIGSNDGTQLKHYQTLGWDVLGVESSKTTAAIANDSDVPTLNRFFNLECINDINKQFSVINAAGVFFHLEELHSVTDAIRVGLEDTGVFVVQFLYMKNIMENNAFDQIYHEHLLYYSLETIQKLLKIHGLEMFDAFLSPIHGGQMIGFVGHPGKRDKSTRLVDLEKAEAASKCNDKYSYFEFANRVAQIKERDVAYLTKCREAGKRIFGMGAPVKGNTLLNYFGIGPETIEFLIEKNELRRGLYSPGMHIPILIEKELEVLPDVYYGLAWNFKTEILRNNQHLIEQGVEFYFPIEPR